MHYVLWSAAFSENFYSEWKEAENVSIYVKRIQFCKFYMHGIRRRNSVLIFCALFVSKRICMWIFKYIYYWLWDEKRVFFSLMFEFVNLKDSIQRIREWPKLLSVKCKQLLWTWKIYSLCFCDSLQIQLTQLNVGIEYITNNIFIIIILLE